MDQQQNKKQSFLDLDAKQLRMIKQTYLPFVICGLAVLLILIFIIGAITRGVQKSQYEKQLALEASIAAQAEQDRLDNEAEQLLSKAADHASHMDYDAALAALDSFSGNILEYPKMLEKYAQYGELKDTLVLWDMPSSVANLSFQHLIADPDRAFADPVYGSSYNRNFITVSEFHLILQQLYENGFVLVSLSDVTDPAGMEIYLPEGKTPFILTQTNVNYYSYMVDSDDDLIADQGGSGFASKLIVDANGNIACEMISAEGEILTGAYDLVPILESFIETHPDFSYKNARAVLSVTGYDGVFGYRTNPEAEAILGSSSFVQEQESAIQVADMLTSLGYELACYTYENVAYGGMDNQQIQSDLNKWLAEVEPIIGTTDIMVFAMNSDIDNASFPYTGEKFTTLHDAGFTRFLGFNTADSGWYFQGEDYIRQGRYMITGSNLAHHGVWFDGFFDSTMILEDLRGEIPA